MRGATGSVLVANNALYSQSGEAIFVLFAGISVVAGIVFQRTVETPLTFWVQRRLGVARGKGIVKPGRDPAQTKESGG